jgi:hypothetical protein
LKGEIMKRWLGAVCLIVGGVLLWTGSGRCGDDGVSSYHAYPDGTDLFSPSAPPENIPLDRMNQINVAALELSGSLPRVTAALFEPEGTRSLWQKATDAPALFDLSLSLAGRSAAYRPFSPAEVPGVTTASHSAALSGNEALDRDSGSDASRSAPVPDPWSMLLGGLGIIGLAAGGRRKLLRRS